MEQIVTVLIVVAFVFFGFVIFAGFANPYSDKDTLKWYRDYRLEVMKDKGQCCVNCAHYKEEFKVCMREVDVVNWDPVQGVETVETKAKTYNCRSTVGTKICKWQAIVRENDSV